MEKIIKNVETGEQTVVQLTAAEISELKNEPTAEISISPLPTLEELQTQLATISAQIDALIAQNNS